jgi:sugar phosphate isomerase/epimerase
MNRRELILAGAAGLSLSGRHALGATKPSSKYARLGATTVCFRDRFPIVQVDQLGGARPEMFGSHSSGGIRLIDAPKFMRDSLGLHNVELWNLQFEELSLDYCRRLKQAAQAVGSRIINIQVDGDYDLSASDPAVRAKGLVYAKGWMDRAKAAGAPTMRANFGPPVGKGEFPLDTVVQSFRELAAYGKSIGVKILAENHTGFSNKIDNVVSVLKAVNDPNCRAIADWGNTPEPDQQTRITDLAKLDPYLALVSAKGLHFDEAWRHVDYDIGALTRATEAGGFHGIYSVELWVTDKLPADPVEAAKSVRDTIAANLKPAKTKRS